MKDNGSEYSKKRLGYMDIAKGIGIICVVLGHMGIHSINRIVFTFHMPLFFIISGYFIRPEKDFIGFCKKKLYQLIVPYWFTVFIMTLLTLLKSIIKNKNIALEFKDILMAGIYGAGSNDMVLPGKIGAIGAIWFLLSLFWAVCIVQFFYKKKYAVIFIVILAAIGFYSSKVIWLPFGIQVGMFDSIFVYFGKLLSDYNILEYNLQKRYFKWSSLVLMLVILAIESRYDISLSLVRNSLDCGAISLIGSLFICNGIIVLSYILDTKLFILRKLLTKTGKNSLIILCFHLVELNYAPWYIIFNIECCYDWVKYGIVIVIKFVYLVLCVWIVNRIKFLYYIFNFKSQYFGKIRVYIKENR